MRMFKYLILAFALSVSAQSVAQDVDIDTEYKSEDRVQDKVRNFFKGGKSDSGDKKERKQQEASKQKKEHRTSKSGKSDNYSLDQLYELSLEENVRIPNLGSQKENIRKYQMQQARKLSAAIQDGRYVSGWKPDLVPVETMRRGEVVILTIETDNLFFPNETNLKPGADRYLKPLLSYLQVADLYRMLLAVHSDNTGSDSYKDELTNKRAMSILSWFQKNAKCSEYIIPYGLGDTEPLYKNDSMDSRAKNRRLEVYLVPGKAMIEKSKKGQLND